MSKTTTMKPAKSNNPRWLDTARAFYADSFGATHPRGLRAAQDDWTDLTEEEQTFALAHLQYLDLMAQAGTQRLLVRIRDVLEEIAEGVSVEREDDDGEPDDEEEEYQAQEPEAFEPPAEFEPDPKLAVREEPAEDGEPDQDAEEGEPPAGEAA